MFYYSSSLKRYFFWINDLPHNLEPHVEISGGYMCLRSWKWETHQQTLIKIAIYNTIKITLFQVRKFSALFFNRQCFFQSDMFFFNQPCCRNARPSLNKLLYFAHPHLRSIILLLNYLWNHTIHMLPSLLNIAGGTRTNSHPSILSFTVCRILT